MPMFGPMHAARMVKNNKRGSQRSASFVSRDGERRTHSEWQREKTERVERLKRLRSASLASERSVDGREKFIWQFIYFLTYLFSNFIN